MTLNNIFRFLYILTFIGISLAKRDKIKEDFGHDLLKYFFHNYTQFNHGAYGGTPRPVIESQYEYVAIMESDIDPWMNSASGYRTCIIDAREAIANITKVKNVNDTVLVDNATEGINVVLRTLEPPLGPDQFIFDLSTEYAPFTGLYQWIGSRYGTQILTADIHFPVTGPESFLDPVRKVLEANASTLNIRIAVITHISAYPAVILPLEELVNLFHSYNIPVVIDGAHALGNIEIDLTKMGDPDYYFANAHKWLFSSKSAAMLYVRRDHQKEHIPAPMLIDSPETNDFIDRFIWTGTRDRTAYCAINSALDFRKSLGGELAIMEYNQNQAARGGIYLVNLWKSRLLGPLEMMSSMISIQVPTDNLSTCQTLKNTLCNVYNICVSASVSYSVADSNIPCYWRLSAQVYLDHSDWVALGELTLSILNDLNALKTSEELGFKFFPL